MLFIIPSRKLQHYSHNRSFRNQICGKNKFRILATILVKYVLILLIEASQSDW